MLYIYMGYHICYPPSRIRASTVCSSQVLYFGLLFCISGTEIKPQRQAASVLLDRKHP